MWFKSKYEVFKNAIEKYQKPLIYGLIFSAVWQTVQIDRIELVLNNVQKHMTKQDARQDKSDEAILIMAKTQAEISSIAVINYHENLAQNERFASLNDRILNIDDVQNKDRKQLITNVNQLVSELKNTSTIMHSVLVKESD